MPIIKENGTKISADMDSVIKADSNSFFYEGFGSMMMDMAINELSVFNYLIEGDYAELDTIRESSGEDTAAAYADSKGKYSTAGKVRFRDKQLATLNPLRIVQGLIKLVSFISTRIKEFFGKHIGALKKSIAEWNAKRAEGNNWLKQVNCDDAPIKSFAKPTEFYYKYPDAARNLYDKFSKDARNYVGRGNFETDAYKDREKSTDDIVNDALKKFLPSGIKDASSFSDAPSAIMKAAFDKPLTDTNLRELKLSVEALQNDLKSTADIDALQKDAATAQATLKEYMKTLKAREAQYRKGVSKSNLDKEEKKGAKKGSKDEIKVLRNSITAYQRVLNIVSNGHVKIVAKHKKQVAAAIAACEAYAKRKGDVKAAKKAAKAAVKEDAVFIESVWREAMSDFEMALEENSYSHYVVEDNQFDTSDFAYIYENDTSLYDDEDED